MVPYAIKAGETVELYTKWNWNNQNTARDWSVTAWGEKGKVYVAHDEGLETAQLPVAPPKPQP